MHQKRAEIQIGEERSRHPFSNSDQQRRVACFVLGQPRLQNLRIQIPIVHSCHEQICSSSLALHRRHTMFQSPCTTSHPPTQYNKGHFHSYSHKATFFCSNPPSVLCLHLYWIRLVLLMLPFLYFFVSHPRLSIPVELIPIVVLSIVLLASFSLALPRLPSIRLFLARSFPSKFTPVSSPNTPPPVVWSIGCKTKLEKCPSSGSSVQVYSNGDVYEGEFHGGKCSGSGVYYYYKSGRYEGDWVDGKYDGFGIETWAKGSKYRGQYRQGLRNGVGVYRFFTGDVYAGEWSNGQSHGSGVHNCEDGSRYSGEFKWGVKHGLGHYHFRNGDTYAGEYFADKMHGFGVYRFGNGHRYEGAWHEGRRQGFGMYSFRNGEAECGHWQNGVIDVLSRPSTDASSPSDLIHPKVLNAVQEACRAADRAQNMPNVDERVKRAVAAANRSANAARVAAVKAVQNQMHQDISIHDFPMAVV